jgi:catechol 2,3-dioxygenase-like lactoylglutathione lyase family enzyme
MTTRQPNNQTKETAIMDLKLEVVVVPVSDVDRAKAYYEKLGFNLDVDHRQGDAFRVVQFTPPGSACSITFGVGLGAEMAPGSLQGLHLVVSDIEATRADLVGRGVDVSDLFHFGEGGQTPGLDPERRDFGTYLSFSDPDGNGWLVQEVPSRGASSA